MTANLLVTLACILTLCVIAGFVYTMWAVADLLAAIVDEGRET
jgi:hypothetical protein